MRFARFLAVLALLLSGLSAGLAPAGLAAQETTTSAATGGSTGLPLPRFVSLRNSPANVRVGPGTRYDVAWVFVKAGVPLEIVQEFDTWRKVRDVEGDEGWLHANLLVGTRTALVTPWTDEGQVALRRSIDAQSAVRAWLRPGLLVEVRRCTGTACEIRFNHADSEGRTTSYSGFVSQETLWGVYSGEVFN